MSKPQPASFERKFLRYALWPLCSPRRLSLVLVLTGVLAVAGCGQKKAEPPAAPQTNAASQAQQAEIGTPPPQVQPSVAPLAQPGGQVDIPELQRAVIRWIVANHRRPANFEDFAATAGVPIPPPPAGKKYLLAPDMHVKLVDR